jgi:hypothetical protein
MTSNPSYHNPDHIQANKLEDKCSAAYPIALLPLRLEARFMHLGPKINKTSHTAAGHHTDYVITGLGKVSNQVGGAKTMNAIATVINNLVEKNEHLPTSINPEETNPLTAWKYAAIGEVLSQNSNTWLPTYYALIDQMTTSVRSVGQLGEGLQVQGEANKALLSTTQREELAIYASQFLQHIATGDVIATTKGDYFLQVAQQLLTQLEQFVQLTLSYTVVHPEDVTIVRVVFDNVKNAVATWHSAAQSHINTFSTQATLLQNQLNTVQNTLNSAYNVLKTESILSSRLPIWKNLSGIHQQLPHAHQALKYQHYTALLTRVSTISNYVNNLVEPVSIVENHSSYTIVSIYMLEAEIEALQAATARAISKQKTSLLHYYIPLDVMKRALEQALEELPSNADALTDITPYLEQMKELVQQLTIVPATDWDGWVAALLLLLPSLQNLTLELRQLAAVNGEEYDQLLSAWNQVDGSYTTWKNAFDDAVANLDTLSSTINNQLAITQQQLVGLQIENFQENPLRKEGEAWGTSHQLRLYTTLIGTHPTWKIANQKEDLTTLKQLVGDAGSQLSEVEQPSTRALFALTDNLGRAAGVVAQIMRMNGTTQELLTQHHNQLNARRTLAEAQLDAIIVQEEAATTYQEVQPALTYLQTYLDSLLDVPTPTELLELLLYDYGVLEQLLEDLTVILTGIASLHVEDKNLLDNQVQILLENVQIHQNEMLTWLNRLVEDLPAMEAQQTSIQNTIATQHDRYIRNHEQATALSIQQHAQHVQHIAQVLEQLPLVEIDKNPWLADLETTALQLANTPIEAVAIAPSYKTNIHAAIGCGKKVAQQAVQVQQQQLQQLQLVTIQAKNSHQLWQDVATHLEVQPEGEPLLALATKSLQQAVQQLVTALQQGSTLGQNLAYTISKTRVVPNAFQAVVQALRALQVQGLVAEDLATINNILAPVRSAWTTWQGNLITQQELVKTRLEGLTAQAEQTRTALGDGQTGVTSMLANGPTTGGYIDNDIICWFPGNLGGGNSGDDDDDNDDPDPTEFPRYELWIRAYPDTIAINNHEKRLTDSEIQDAIIYWTTVWNAAGNNNVELGAWRTIVGKYGAERAAWIIRQLTPTNLSQRPLAVTIASSTVQDVVNMGAEEVALSGASFWQDMTTTQASPQEQTGIINNFKQIYPNDKATVISHLTRPEQLGLAFYDATYHPSANNGVDQAPIYNLRATTEQIQQRQQQLLQHLQVAELSQPTPQFPVLTPEERRDNTWSMAAYTEVMPDQLAFLLYNWEGEVVHEVVGNLIPEKLQMGIDPKDENQFDPTKSDLGIKHGTIRWMTDFEEAVTQGMAVKIPISDEEGAPSVDGSGVQAGFFRVYALGIKHYDRDQETSVLTNNIQTAGQQQLEELLEAHHYTKGGLAILPPGTPTNNTSTGTTNFSMVKDQVKESYQTEIQQQLPANKDAARPADGHLLAEALGINSTVFKHIQHNVGTSSHNAEVMNKALWMSTWGVYLEEMFSHKQGFFQTDDFLPSNLTASSNEVHYFKLPEDLDKVYQYFTKHVKGRGSLPAIRVGNQPYGILTTGMLQDNYRGWQWWDASAGAALPALGKDFLDNLQILLLSHLWGYKTYNNTASKKWSKVVEQHIKTVDDLPLMPTGGVLTALQEQFIKILRLHPTAASYYARYALNPYSSISTDVTGFSDGNYRSLFRGSNVSLLNNWTQFSSSMDNEFISLLDYYKDTSNDIRVPSISNTIINELRLFETYGNGSTETLQPLTGAVVTEGEEHIKDKTLAVINGTTTNYIQWLRTTAADQIITRSKQIDKDFTQGGEPSTSLLYIALRNALLNQYWDAAMRILEKEQFRDYSMKQVNHAGAAGWQGLYNYNTDSSTTPLMKHYTNYDTINDEVYSALSLSTTWPDTLYNFGYLKRQSYKAFVTDVNPSSSKDTPEYGAQVELAGGRLPFLMQVNTNDVDGITASNMTMAAYLFPGTGISPINALADYPTETAPLKAMLEALDVLAEIPVAELERLFAEHMDLASHRLDAWILGLANHRLEKMRTNHPTGTYLGSYGWLMNLEPGGQRTAVNNSSVLYNIDYDINGNPQIPIMHDPDNQGYIQAPSLNHAMTAAVLRSGYEAHKGTAEEDLLAVKLTSGRVKRALFYIEGIRNGQHLGALLGYRIERELREANLAQYTLVLRENYPIEHLQYEDANQQPLEPTAPSSVVNGLLIIERLREMETLGHNFATAFSYINAADQAAVATVLNKAVEDMDALADLSLAEGTYQMVLGNYSRSNAMMTALAKGTPIPEPDIINTPRTGQASTHRVGLTLAAVNTATASPQWATAFTPRALAEPQLNAKIGELLPDPTQVQCQVNYLHQDANGQVLSETTYLSLASLEIEPIDLLYSFPERMQDTHSELAKRFQQTAYTGATPFSNDSFYAFEVNFEVASSSAAYTVADIAPLMAQLQLLCSNSRYLRAADLVHPSADTTNMEVTGVTTNNLLELASRANNLRNAMHQAANNLAPSANAATIWEMALYGIEQAMLPPPSIALNAMIDYSNQITVIQQLMWDRVAQYDKLRAPIFNDPDLTTADKVEIYQKAASVLLGKSFLLLPQITVLNVGELANAYAAKDSILPANEPLVVERWTAGAARVRRQVNRLENVSFLQGIFLDEQTASLEWQPIQLPYRPSDHWVGVEVPTDYYQQHFTDTNPVSLDKLSLVMNWHAAPSATPLVGLLVDEWTESIPAKEETAGLAFHYNQPNSKAPQSILLAVHPRDSTTATPWSWSYLVETLETTLELSKMRAVEPDHLQTVTVDDTQPTQFGFDAFSQLLPATYALVAPPTSEESWSSDYHTNTNTHLHKTN